MASRRLSAWDLVDEVMTEMSDANFGWWSSDRITFRNALIDEVKRYIVEEEIEVTNPEPEIDEEE